MDYSGHIPTPDVSHPSGWREQYPAFADAIRQDPVQKSPIQLLIDQMIDKTNEAREKLLRNLIENPGVLATFDNGFIVEFGDIELETIDSPDRNLNEYNVAITQKWRIRRREEEDGPAGASLGRDPGGEARTD